MSESRLPNEGACQCPEDDCTCHASGLSPCMAIHWSEWHAREHADSDREGGKFGESLFAPPSWFIAPQ